jgi:hypothetical protein
LSKVVGESEHAVGSGGADQEGIVVTDVADELQIPAGHSHRGKKTAIFKNFQLLTRRFCAFPLLHVIRIGNRGGSLRDINKKAAGISGNPRVVKRAGGATPLSLRPTTKCPPALRNIKRRAPSDVRYTLGKGKSRISI